MADLLKNSGYFLQPNKNGFSKYISYAGLGMGVFLLLASVQLYININQLLKSKNNPKAGFDFVSITKTVTDQTMGSDNCFSETELNELRYQPFIKDAAPLLSNQFRITATITGIAPFSTDIFLESIKNDFIDTLPAEFSWSPGQIDVPIIFSADFLEMYNVFAPTQDLPQLSESSLSAINITLDCYGSGEVRHFRGHVVALSDRINSILVPNHFLQWSNHTFGKSANPMPARVYLKTNDANGANLLSYIQQKNYHINKDKTKFGRIKIMLQSAVKGIGIFAILVILLAMMLFSFYLQIMIARNKDNLKLLLLLGYSPSFLSQTVTKKWSVTYACIIFSALGITTAMQYLFQHFSLDGKNELSAFPSMIVVSLTLLLLLSCLVFNYRLVNKLLGSLR